MWTWGTHDAWLVSTGVALYSTAWATRFTEWRSNRHASTGQVSTVGWLQLSKQLLMNMQGQCLSCYHTSSVEETHTRRRQHANPNACRRLIGTNRQKELHRKTTDSVPGRQQQVSLAWTAAWPRMPSTDNQPTTAISTACRPSAARADRHSSQPPVCLCCTAPAAQPALVWHTPTTQRPNQSSHAPSAEVTLTAAASCSKKLLLGLLLPPAPAALPPSLLPPSAAAGAAASSPWLLMLLHWQVGCSPWAITSAHRLSSNCCASSGLKLAGTDLMGSSGCMGVWWCCRLAACTVGSADCERW